jgi:O-antigen chain-terminating methyltransferase
MNQLMAANIERVDVQQRRADVQRLREVIADEEAHLLDGFYAALADAFRGSREEVREKLKVYLPYFSSAGPDGAASAVLDLGWWTRRWLEMLREQGFKGHGVDLNRVAPPLQPARAEVTEGAASLS